MKNNAILLGGFILLLSGCANSAPETAPKKIGMANPASVYCEKLGGTVHIKKTPQGEVGMCELADKTEIEEWTLFRRDNKPQ